MKKKDLIFFIIGSAIVIILVILFNIFIGGPMSVTGDSMNPYLEDKDVVIVNKLAYKGDRKPERFDIVVFPYRENKKVKYVKRIIGLPGETIKIEKDRIYVLNNGVWEEIKEYYGQFIGFSLNSSSDYGPITIGEDEYFVLGDNRYHSTDSRMDDVGLVNISEIIGKVEFRVLPFSNFGSLTNDSGTVEE